MAGFLEGVWILGFWGGCCVVAEYKVFWYCGRYVSGVCGGVIIYI